MLRNLWMTPSANKTEKEKTFLVVLVTSFTKLLKMCYSNDSLEEVELESVGTVGSLCNFTLKLNYRDRKRCKKREKITSVVTPHLLSVGDSW